MSGEIAFYRILLQRALQEDSSLSRARWVCEVGCRNWAYLPAVAEAFPHARITGVEITGREWLWNLKRRESRARAVVQKCARTHAQPIELVTADFRAWSGLDVAGDGVFLFLYPFVSQAPARAWGLRAEHARWDAWIDHALSLGRANSNCKKISILSAHQGEWEAEQADAQAAHLPRPEAQSAFEVESSAWRHTQYPQRFAVHGRVREFRLAAPASSWQPLGQEINQAHVGSRS